MRLGAIAENYGRVVTATLSGSAAEAAGIRIGDVVMTIEGLPTAGLNEEQIKDQMRGPVGSLCDIVVVRNHPWQVRTLWQTSDVSCNHFHACGHRQKLECCIVPWQLLGAKERLA